MKRHCLKKKNKGCRKLLSQRGMTMAELLMTVGIIIILMAVAFISILYYQRSLAQTERDGIAKEIFIAAQNHLTMAKGEGYLDVTKPIEDAATPEARSEQELAIYGPSGNQEGESGVHYFVVDGNINDNDPQTLLDLMLPFGAIDESIRTGDSFIIRYQPKTGTVLDVFYCSKSGSPARFNHTLTDEDFDTVMGLRDVYDKDGNIVDDGDHKKDRRSWDVGEGGPAVLGWYGNAEADKLPPLDLHAPEIKVTNGDVLSVNISDPNDNKDELRIIITGLTSHKKMALDVLRTGTNKDKIIKARVKENNDTEVDPSALQTYKCSYILDDVTGLHFIKLNEVANKTGNLLPGEDIKVQVAAFSSTSFANIAYSNIVRTNSLYKSISKEKSDTDNSRTAYISSIRHLENLHSDISGRTNGPKAITITAAKQSDDLSWGRFVTNTGGAVKTNNDSSGTTAANYYPVSISSGFVYDGLRHTVDGVKSSFSGPAGMFGAAAGSTVRNLKLTDFDITGTTNAGALIAVATNSTVSNVVAYNTDDFDGLRKVTVNATSGTAGGLVGTMNNGGTVKYSAAALNVSAGSTAGGLVGQVTGDGTATIRESFSGGHTQHSEYYRSWTHDESHKLYNVDAGNNGTAGGLIGAAGSSTIQNSYSTCSVKGGSDKTGGLVGTAAGTVTKCYCTGLVSGDNAFIGSGNANISSSYFFEIINEYEKDDGSIGYKPSGAAADKVRAIDNGPTSYDDFVKGAGKWNDANPYDGYLTTFYDGKYNLMTVTQLEAQGEKASGNSSDLTDKKGLFVNSHYGDWPSPELFAVNE